MTDSDHTVSPSVPRDVVADNRMCDSDFPISVAGVSEFMTLRGVEADDSPPPAWAQGLSADDVATMKKLGALTTTGLIMEVKKLHDLAYQLGMEEIKEMTRGKYLNIFKDQYYKAPKKT